MSYDQYPASSYPPAGYGAPPDPYAAGYGAPQPYPAYHAAPSYPSDEPRTIFITGFPTDVKERELNNLLRFLPGYEASQMNWKNGQAQGFAMFANTAMARGGSDAISQLCFDEGSVLRCEMARKNMYIKDDTGAKRPRAGAPSSSAPGAYGAAVSAARPSAPAYAGRPGAQGYAPITNTGDNPPCNTLFVGNLGDSTDENELRSLFANQPGFRQLKLVRGPRNTSCFIEFADVPSAMAAHQSQQGAVLSSSDRGGLRVQYSKNPFGRKRDFADLRGGPDDQAGYGGGAPGGSGGPSGGSAVKAGYTPAEYQPPGDGADPAAPGV